MNSELESLFNQAFAIQHAGNLPQAISLYQELLLQDPNHSNALHFLGLCYAQLGDLEHALQHLEKAAQITHDDPGLFNNLANAYKRQHRYDQAISYYLKAIKIKPDYAQAHNNLATIYTLQNKYKDALQHYKIAVHASPDFSAAHFNLGLLLLQNNELNAARTQFNNVISLNPLHWEALFYLGVLNLESNQLDNAEQAFLKVLEHDSEHVQAITNLGVIALKKEKNQVAVDYFSKALVIDIDHIDARNNLASTFMHHDRFENALMHYDVLLQNDSQNIEYLYNSGVAEMALGHLNEAIVFFEQVLDISSEHTHSLNNMAAIYVKMEQKELAREFLERVLAINPSDNVSLHMLSAIKGSKNAMTTPEYAQNLFNNYALYYDQHMKGQLHYSIPEHIGRILHQLHVLQVNKTLDLGCGTGLTGIVLREISKSLTGVDIAPKMLAHAKEKHIYDALFEAELLQFFKENGTTYDLVVAADVIPYFGDLKRLFAEVETHLNKAGYFIFTTEITSSNPWQLETSARFSHHPDYIKKHLAEHQLKLITMEPIHGRLQNNKPIEIMVYAAQRH